MKILFLLFFSYMFYRLLIRPLFIESPTENPSSSHKQNNSREEKINIRYKEDKQRKEFKGGEYVDYEEIK